MKNKLIILGCLFTASFFVACNQEDKPIEETTQKEEIKEDVWQPEMVAKSELAVLMRDMWDENMLRKKQLLNGQPVDSFPKSYYTVHSAVPTDPKVKTDIYASFADLYLAQMQQVNEAPDSIKVKAFNVMVETCITCHTEYCPGPIPTIKKLRIKEKP